MKVAFISTVRGHRWPGSEYLWAAAADKLLADGHAVFARCSLDIVHSDAVRTLRRMGMRCQLFGPSTTRMARLLARCSSFSRRIEAWRPDLLVVSAGSAFDIAYLPPLARYLARTTTPFIIICHFNAETFPVDHDSRRTMRGIYRKAAGSVFVSADNRRITERQLALKIDGSIVLHPPLPVSLESPLPWPRTTGGGIEFACVARLEPRWKGQDVLLEVLSHPRWKTREWKLNLYGEGGEEGYLRELATHFGIGERVVFRGHLQDRPRIWAENHLQLLAARGEGGPMVLTEGMMCGRAAVITACGNAREFVTPGGDGFLVESATAACFARGLEEAWARRAEWRAMGVRAHEKMRARREPPPHLGLLAYIESTLKRR